MHVAAAPSPPRPVPAPRGPHGGSPEGQGEPRLVTLGSICNPQHPQHGTNSLVPPPLSQPRSSLTCASRRVHAGGPSSQPPHL
ncbi:hypothetical protein E2C01_080393 [Portunus trituberculatus]|uniref:Uncharacterized protein n=1 Tax=Portunus trituberculatus TaxID=210409 RepID=A0A5B7IP71_PORTR|nr:hypothetical protein [Portunus trituberculatus]